MCKIINENTIVTLFEVAFDYMYLWGLKVPITDALNEIYKKQIEEGRRATYHICIGDTGLNRICSIANNNIRFDDDMCFPNVKTISDLLTQNGTYEFCILDDTWSLEKSLIYAGV